jgi:acylphosphatase
MADVAAHVVVHGQVQGVAYRITLRHEAGQRQVKGWVRNREDGSVEAVLQGEHDAVERVISWARTGPSGANVRKVDVDWVPPDATWQDFEIRP